MQPTAAQLAATGGKAVEGAWYGNQRYVGGQLLAPNQSAPGKTVSNEVNAQSAKAQGKDPSQFIAYATGAPTSNSSNPQNELNTFQQSASTAMGNIGIDASKSDEQILAEVKSNLEPSTPVPTAPNMAATFNSFLNSPGLGGVSVNDMNTQLTSLNQQIATVQSTLEARQNAEIDTGGKVALGVISGRQSEEARQAQVQLDSLNLQKGVLVDAINMQMTNINTIMQLTQQDYQNTLQSWQAEFDVNSKIYDAFTSQVANRNDLSFKQQQLAATNLQTFANLLTSGNISYSNLSSDQKLQVTQMETQAGLPIGTLENIQLSPKDKLLNVSSYKGQVTAITMSNDGKISTQTFGQVNDSLTPYEQYNIDNKQNVSDANNAAIQDAQNGASLEQLTQIYGGTLTPTEINTIYNDYGTGA